MFMRFKESLPVKDFPGFNPRTFGYETCLPGYSYGVDRRTHWIIQYVEEGFGTFTRDGVTHRVRPGEFFVIPPLVETVYRADTVQPWSYIWVGFTVKDPELTEIFSQPVIFCPEAGNIFRAMRQSLKLEAGKRAYLAGCLWDIFALLKEKETEKPDAVDLAVAYMEAEYASDLTVGGIAQRLGLDRSYFSTQFTARMGIPPRNYLLNYRLNKAAELMTVHEKKPSTAALSVGFDDLFHFSKAFKNHFGIPPREYVKRYKEEN